MTALTARIRSALSASTASLTASPLFPPSKVMVRSAGRSIFGQSGPASGEAVGEADFPPPSCPAPAIGFSPSSPVPPPPQAARESPAATASAVMARGVGRFTVGSRKDVGEGWWGGSRPPDG